MHALSIVLILNCKGGYIHCLVRLQLTNKMSQIYQAYPSSIDQDEILSFDDREFRRYIYHLASRIRAVQITGNQALPTPQVLVQVPSNESLWKKTLKISKNSITILIAVGLFCANIYLLSVDKCECKQD